MEPTTTAETERLIQQAHMMLGPPLPPADPTLRFTLHCRKCNAVKVHPYLADLCEACGGTMEVGKKEMRRITRAVLAKKREAELTAEQVQAADELLREQARANVELVRRLGNMAVEEPENFQRQVEKARQDAAQAPGAPWRAEAIMVLAVVETFVGAPG